MTSPQWKESVTMPSRLRQQAIRALEEWHDAMGTLVAPVTHPLQEVGAFHLDTKAVAMGRHRVYAIETRAFGKSRIPIRDLPRHIEQTHRILRHIQLVEDQYFQALVAWVECRTFQDVAHRLRCSKSRAHERFNCGIAILQSRLLLP